MAQSGSKVLGIMQCLIGICVTIHIGILGSLLMRVLGEHKRHPVIAGKPTLVRAYLMVTAAIGSVLSIVATVCWLAADNAPVAFAYATTSLGTILMTMAMVIALVRGLPQSGYDNLNSAMRLVFESE